MALLLTLLAVFALLVLNELWWRTHAVHDELSRKFVHITVGSFVAFWPFYLGWGEIELLSVAFLVVVAASQYMSIFKAIHSVDRTTWGEIYFAVVIGAVAFITHDKYIYAAALLQLSLADGLAAIVGTRFGKSNRYTVLKHTKSVVGTLTFYLVSLVILYGFTRYSGEGVQPLLLLAIAAGASVLENIGARGLDNILVPVFVATLLHLLTAAV